MQTTFATFRAVPGEPTATAYEAKTHFSQLLERAANGETIVITKHGHPVAKLAPLTDDAGIRRVRAEAAAASIRSRREGFTLGAGLTIRDLVEEGRRR